MRAPPAENILQKASFSPDHLCAFAEVGWRMEVKPKSHPVNQLEFNVIIGADGRRNTLPGDWTSVEPDSPAQTNQSAACSWV